MKKEVVLIFGVFNPVTNAHVDMGTLSHEAFPKADVVYVPTSDSYITKSKHMPLSSLIPIEDRLKLLWEAVHDIATVSLVEVNGTVSGKTYDTVQYFKTDYRDVILCVGADKLSELHTWYRSEELVNNCGFIVITRNGEKGNLHKPIAKYGDHFMYMEGRHQRVSSTVVRNAVRDMNTASIRSCVPENVYDYLYRNPFAFR